MATKKIKLKLKVGDIVRVMRGRSKGKEGKLSLLIQKSKELS